MKKDNNLIPKIKCIKRTIKAENWPNGFIYYCLQYSNGKYSSDYVVDKIIKEEIIKEEIIYEGSFPNIYRILPKVNNQYLKTYVGGFRSQIIPNKVNMEIAESIRGKCWNMYDRQCYNKNGEIISTEDKSENDVDGVYEYCHSLLSKEDWKRIAKFEEIDIKTWKEY